VNNKIKTIRGKAGASVEVYKSAGGRYLVRVKGKKPDAVIHRDSDTGAVYGVEHPDASRSDMLALSGSVTSEKDALNHAGVVLRAVEGIAPVQQSTIPEPETPDWVLALQAGGPSPLSLPAPSPKTPLAEGIENLLGGIPGS
jgi:hypothetical protein